MRKLLPILMILLLFTGCAPESSTIEPETEYEVGEPRLSVTEVYKALEKRGEIITDTETGRQFLFYGSYKYGAGLIELTQPEPEEPAPAPVEPEPQEPTEPDEDINVPTEPVRYPLTDEERRLVNEVVMAESGNQPYCGQMGVAQCLLNDCERNGIRPAEAVLEYQYTPNRVEPSESVQRAVSAVFDRGEVVTAEVILWFYAPDRVDGTPWHESQRHVLTINDHKFFAEKE